MEERYIELIAVGHSFGESISMNVLEQKGPMFIEEPFDLQLQISSKGATLEMRPGELRGFEPSSEPLRIETEGKEFFCQLPLVPVGKPGPSLVRVVIKGDQYFATLAISEFDVKLLPPRVALSITDAPIHWDAGGSLIFRVGISCGRSRRVKGQLKLSLTGVEGSSGPVYEASLPVSIRGTDEVEFDIPTWDIHTPEGSLDVDLFFEDENRSVHERFRDAIIVEEGPETEEENGTASKPVVEMDEDEIPKYLSVVNARFDPDNAPPGTSVRFRLEISRGEGLEGDVEGKLEMGPGMEFPFKVPAGSESTEIKVRLPDSIRGPTTPILTLNPSGMEPVRTVLTRSLTIRGTGQMVVRKIDHFDISDGTGSPQKDLLYPGETVSRRRSMGEFEVLDLTTGRHLCLYRGEVVLGPGWDVSLTEDAFSHLIALELRDSLLDPEHFRELRKGLDELGRFSRMMLSGECTPGDLDKWWKAPSVRKKADRAEGLVGSLLKRFGPDGMLVNPLKRVKGETNDPVPIIQNHLTSLLLLEDLGDGPRDYLELLIRELRSSPTPNLELARKVHHRILSDVRGALDEITGEGDRTGDVIHLLLALVLSQLVRIEVLSTWSDPAIAPWDELRIERQRSIKGEIGSLMDLAGSLIRIHRTMLQRIVAYRSNMRTRSELHRSSRMRLSPSTRAPSGDFGEEWRGSIRFEMVKGSSASVYVPFIGLPGPSWSLVSPPSTRDGNIYTLEPMKTREDGTMVLDLIVSSPPDQGKDPLLLVYLSPPDTRLEVEP